MSDYPLSEARDEYHRGRDVAKVHRVMSPCGVMPSTSSTQDRTHDTRHPVHAGYGPRDDYRGPRDEQHFRRGRHPNERHFDHHHMREDRGPSHRGGYNRPDDLYLERGPSHRGGYNRPDDRYSERGPRHYHDNRNNNHHPRHFNDRRDHRHRPYSRDQRQHRREEGNAQDVADFYNAQPNAGLVQRRRSKIFHMRTMNNWIKSVLINKSLGLLGDEQTRLRVLDLCCGKGGDLLKWKKHRLGHLAAIDIAGNSVDQCRRRAQQARLNCSMEFHVADCTRDDIKDVLQKGEDGASFHVSSCQFAVHYGFESEAQAHRLLDNACQHVRPGGVFIGTTPDADCLLERHRQADGPTFGNSIYSVTFDETALTASEPPPFGAKYHFQLDGAVDVPEYLVDFSLLCRILWDRHRMKLVWKKSFHEFVYEEREIADNKALLRQMRVPSLPEDSTTAGPGSRPARDTISQEEWEAVGLYIVFCFQKQSNDELQVVKMPEQSEGSEEQGPGLGQEIKEQGQEQDQEQDQERFQEGEEQRQGEECGEED